MYSGTTKQEEKLNKKSWSPRYVQEAKEYYKKILSPRSEFKFGECHRGNTQHQQIVLPEWKSDEHRSKSPLSNRTAITTIKQYHDLYNVSNMSIVASDCQGSVEWLKSNKIRVDIKDLQNDLLESTSSNVSTESGDDSCIVDRRKEKLLRHLDQLNQYLESLEERTKWLLKGSRKIFGVLTGFVPCILIDTSDCNLTFDRLLCLKENLKLLLKEQLLFKKKVLLASYGSGVSLVWNQSKNMNEIIAQEMEDWINNIQASGSSNILNALKTIFKQKDIDSIVIVTGSQPDQPTTAVIDYVEELHCGSQLSIHTVSYHNQLLETKMFLEELALRTHGRYHCFSLDNEEAMLKGTDLNCFMEEIKSVKDAIEQIEDVMNRMNRCDNVVARIPPYGSRSSSRSNYLSPEPTSFLSHHDLVGADYHYKQEKKLQRLDQEYYSISIQPSSVLLRTSKDWLKSYGLKVQGLTLYQVMAPNAYSYVKSYVSIINKQIESRIHHQSMVQMDWHDGSIKNVHVDPVILSNYQHNLQNVLSCYANRLNWLLDESRRAFGNIIEQRVVIIVDMSNESDFAIGELEKHIKVLFEQQLSNKTHFNLVCFADSVHVFHKFMVEVTAENIAACWRWFVGEECSGVRSILPAVRFVLENEEENKKKLEVQGIYLITTGAPKETKDIITNYISESLSGTNTTFNCIYFQPPAANTFYTATRHTSDILRSLSHENNGRFHWSNGNDIVESDDVTLVNAEMNRASNYLNKSKILLEKMESKALQRKQTANTINSDDGHKETIAKIKNLPVNSAEQKKRKSQRRIVSAKLRSSSAKHAWRPTSAHSSALIPEVPSSVPGKTFKDVNERVVCDHEKPLQRTFYTEVGNSVGTVFTSKSRKKPTSRWTPTSIKIPDKEEAISSKDWLNQYGLLRLKLHINSLSPTFECKHSELGSFGHTRYCNIFPSYDDKGTSYHVHANYNELSDYEKHLSNALVRYTKRLKWLLQGSRGLFGTLIEKNIIIIVDISGSMADHLNEIKNQFEELVWDQIYNKERRFNLICYSTNVMLWQECLVEASKENCQFAIDWMTSMKCFGETNTLEAFQVAFDLHPDLEGIYLLTDGKPDQSTATILREVVNMNMMKKVRIHTISFNCNDRAVNKFLHMLALQSRGRYHRFTSKNFNTRHIEEVISGQKAEERILEGDDSKILANEIKQAKEFLMKTKFYKVLIEKGGKELIIANEVEDKVTT